MDGHPSCCLTYAQPSCCLTYGWTLIVLLNLSCCMCAVCRLSTRCMYTVKQLDRLLWIFVCTLPARCTSFCLGHSWKYGTFITKQWISHLFQTGGLLQYMLHLKSCSVEVLMFPGICMEENEHKMEF